MAKLINNGTLTANGDGVSCHVSGGTAHAACSGTFGSGTMTLYISYDGTNYITTGIDGIKTADATFRLDNLPDCYLKWTLTGATTPSVKWAISGNA